MPIVVNEIVIKATVGDSVANEQPPPGGQNGPPLDVQELVEACVAEVLRVLERKKER